MGATQKIVSESKGESLETEAPKSLVLPKEEVQPKEANGNQRETTDMSGPVTTSKEVRDLQESMSFSTNPSTQKAATTATKVAAGTLLGSGAVGVVGAYEGFMTGLGAIAATMESFEDGYLGDVFDTREREEARDFAEDQGFSVSDTAASAQADKLGQTNHEFSTTPSLESLGNYGLAEEGITDLADDPAGYGGIADAVGESFDPSADAKGLNGGSLGDAAAGNGNDSGGEGDDGAGFGGEGDAEGGLGGRQ
jgi:hypothetical protein